MSGLGHPHQRRAGGRSLTSGRPRVRAVLRAAAGGMRLASLLACATCWRSRHRLPEIEFAPGDDGRPRGRLGRRDLGARLGRAAGAQGRRAGQHASPVPARWSARSRSCSTPIYGATVEATEPSVLRHAADGRALLAQRSGDHPAGRDRPGRAAELRHHLPRRSEAPVRRRAGPVDGRRRAAPAGAAARRRPRAPARRAIPTPSTDGAGRAPHAAIARSTVRRRFAASAAASARGCRLLAAHQRSPRRRPSREIDLDVASAPDRSGGRR